MEDTFEDFWRVELSAGCSDIERNPNQSKLLRFALFLCVQLYELHRPRRSSQHSEYDLKATGLPDSSHPDRVGSPGKEVKEESEETRPGTIAARQQENDSRFQFVHKHLGDFVSTLLMLVPDRSKVPQSVVDALGFILGAKDPSTGRSVVDLSRAVEHDVPLMGFVVDLGQRLVANRGVEGWDTPKSPTRAPHKKNVGVFDFSHIVIRGVQPRDFIFLPRSVDSCSTSYVANCKASTIIVLSPVNFAYCVSCTDCTIILGPALGVLTLELCERTRIVGLCTRLRLINCVDVKVNVWTGKRPLLKGDSRGVVAGPLSARYPQVASDITRIADPQYVIQGSRQNWRFPILADAGGIDETDTVPEVAFAVQTAEDFLFEPALGTDGIIAPPLPLEYATRLETRKRVVEETARLVQAAIVSAGTTRAGGAAAARQDLHGVIVAAFKDYLADNNQMDAILDVLKPADDLLRET